MAELRRIASGRRGARRSAASAFDDLETDTLDLGTPAAAPAAKPAPASIPAPAQPPAPQPEDSSAEELPADSAGADGVEAFAADSDGAPTPKPGALAAPSPVGSLGAEGSEAGSSSSASGSSGKVQAFSAPADTPLRPAFAAAEKPIVEPAQPAAQAAAAAAAAAQAGRPRPVSVDIVGVEDDGVEEFPVHVVEHEGTAVRAPASDSDARTPSPEDEGTGAAAAVEEEGGSDEDSGSDLEVGALGDAAVAGSRAARERREAAERAAADKARQEEEAKGKAAADTAAAAAAAEAAAQRRRRHAELALQPKDRAGEEAQAPMPGAADVLGHFTYERTACEEARQRFVAEVSEYLGGALVGEQSAAARLGKRVLPDAEFAAVSAAVSGDILGATTQARACRLPRRPRLPRSGSPGLAWLRLSAVRCRA